MPTRRDGEAILSTYQSTLKGVVQDLRGILGREEFPEAYRRKQRQEAVAKAKQAHEVAARSFAGWSRDFRADANARLQADETGSPAEETRRLRLAIETQSLVQAAQLADERSGSKIVGGRVVSNPTAHSYVTQARDAYLAGQYDRAIALATAAETLGADPGNVRQLAQEQLWLAVPEKRDALKDLAIAQRAEAIYARDTNSLLADALQAAATAAQEVGDDHRALLREAVSPSMTSKLAAMAIARLDETDYEVPQGALDSVPTGGVVKDVRS